MTLRLLTFIADMDPFDSKGIRYSLTTNTSKALVINVPNIHSYPPPIITWYKNEIPMNTAGSRHQITLDGSLVLLDRDTSDSGNSYRIEALNGNTNTFEDGPVYSVTVAGKVINRKVFKRFW